MFAMLAFPTAAFAESLNGGSGWNVTYTSGGDMAENYPASGFADNIRGLQPGDDITFTMTLNQENATASDWYMKSEVIKSLESGSASGSVYGYLLTFTDASGQSTTLYDSAAVGGDETKGLEEVQIGTADEKYVYLTNLSQGQSGQVTLKVTLDGETEGNAYFNTLAQLKMAFAVDPVGDNGTTNRTRGADTNPNRSVVKTGDDTNLFPFYVVMVASGALLVGLGALTIRQRKKNEEEGAR